MDPEHLSVLLEAVGQPALAVMLLAVWRIEVEAFPVEFDLASIELAHLELDPGHVMGQSGGTAAGEVERLD